MAQAPCPTLLHPLTTLLPREKVAPEAQRLEVVVRRRTLDLSALVWTLVLGFQTGSRRSIAALHWTSQKASHPRLARSSFDARCTPQLATLLRSLAQEALTAYGPASGVVPQRLASFQELRAMDRTVVRLQAWLAKA